MHTLTKIEKNKPDFLVWNNDNNSCQLMEITVPLDTSLELSTSKKNLKYIPLISQLQRLYLYQNYRFSIVTVTVGGLGAIPKDLEEKLNKIGIEPGRIKTTIGRLQKAAILGTMKIFKTTQNVNYGQTPEL